MIPAKAVEAAAKGVWAKSVPTIPWEQGTNRARAIYLQDAQWALESAAPHMLAEVDVQWGVRDKASIVVAGHPSRESAERTVAEHPNWYEVVSRARATPWEAAK